MGKQKSYILVGSVFLGFILLMLLVTIISNNVKKTKVMFDSEVYTVEVGKTRALTPTIYAGGKVLDDVIFTYESDNGSVFSVQPGCFSSGTAAVDCWVFIEAEEDGTADPKYTVTPYNEDDVITINEELYWCVNGEKTRARANRQYTEEEIANIVSKAPAEIECFYLNGLPTNIPYDKDVTPVRNAETKTWFINGKDTKVAYDGIPTTIEGVSVGSAKITAKAVIDGDEFKLTATITVCEPDPKALEINHIDSTIIVNVNDEFSIDYKVVSDNTVADPKQDVKLSCPSGLTLNGNVFTATKVGEYKVSVTVKESSFQLAVPKTISKTVKVIVVDTTDEQLELVEAARNAIEAIGTLSNTDECKARYEVAKEAVSKVLEENITLITNYKTYEKAQNKFDNVGTE